jgi:hypothetical protein
MKQKDNSRLIEILGSQWLWFIFLGIAAVARLIFLKSDPPVDLARGQSLWTDPSQYVFFARNLVQFGRMDCFIPSGLIFFKYSLMSFISIPFFYLFSPGVWQSNFVSSLISIAAVFIFSYSMRKVYGGLTGNLAALFAGSAYIFVMHNRVPYLENPSLLLLSLSIYFLFSGLKNQKANFWSGFTLAASILIGKTLAVMVAPAFILYFGFTGEKQVSIKQKFMSAVPFIIGFFAFSAAALLIFYLPNYLASKQYLTENVISYYGFPDGLKSIAGFIRNLYTFDLVNMENAFFDRLPVISIAALLFLGLLIPTGVKSARDRMSLIFSAWLICGILFLSPWNYRPIRYEMYIMLPLAALAAVFLGSILSSEHKFGLLRIIPLSVTASLIVFHFYFYISKSNQMPDYPFWNMFFISLVIGIIAAFVIYYLFKFTFRLNLTARVILIILISLFSLSFDIKYYIGWYSKLTYGIEYINHTLGAELGKDAVIMGPYAQAVTLDNELKAEIFYFGAYPKNDSLFARIPATHIIYEAGMGGGKSGTEAKVEEYYPYIYSTMRQVDSYLIGRYYVNVFNVTEGSRNSAAKQHPMNDFEKGIYYYNNNIYDTALTYLQTAKSTCSPYRASLYIGNIYYKLGQMSQAKEAYKYGLEDDCYDPKFWAMYSIACKSSGDFATAEKAKQKALKYAPYGGFFQNVNF